MLSLAGVLASQSPQLKAMSEKRSAIRDLNKKEKALSAARDVSAQANADVAQDYQDQLADVAKAQFELSPTKESAEKMLEQRSYSTEGQEARATTVTADPEEIAMERFEQEQFEQEVEGYLNQYRESSKADQAQAEQKAKEAVQVKQAAKRKTRRNFLDYMKDEPTSLGGTFGELDPKLQKQIAKQYTKAQKKQIMDRKDAGNE